MRNKKLIKLFFAISSLIAIVYPLINTYFIFPSFTGVLVENTEEDAIRVARSLSAVVVAENEELKKPEAFSHEIEKMQKEFNLIKIKVFSPGGQTVYSTDSKDVGVRNEKKYFHEIVAEGMPYTKVVEKDAKSLEGQKMRVDVVETYVPIMKKNRFLGAFEIYYDITNRTHLLNKKVLQSSLISFALMFGFFLLILIVLCNMENKSDDPEDDTEPLNYHSVFYLLITMITAIFISETVIMFVLSYFPPMSVITSAIIDSALLVVLVSPVFYFFLFRPLLRHIKQRRRAEKKLKYQALYDHLTNLPNRTYLRNSLKRLIDRSKRDENYQYGVLFIDLDRFKIVNDSLGHVIGDQLLTSAAERLKNCVRPSDTVARFGGDEFAVVLDYIKDLTDATRVADRIQRELTIPFRLNGHDVFITASIGIVISLSGYENVEDIIRDADAAMYRAKSLGKARYEIFNKNMHSRALKLLQLESDLRQAVTRNEFFVYYQPIVSLQNFNISGVEALLRWEHPQRGIIPPAEFIPLAEETGLIAKIGEQVLMIAAAQNKEWHDAGYDHLHVGVNFSAHQFIQQDIVKIIKKTLNKTGLHAQFLNIEITESTAMEMNSTNTLLELSALGVKLSIDDFGTGYSSLGSLKNFAIDCIKIDKVFIQDVTRNKNADAIVKAIIAMAKNLKITVIAEGVETEEQLNFLRSHDCDQIQGFIYSRPVPDNEFTALLEKENTLKLDFSRSFNFNI
jgi:diguanylate cyclase (GGDEF)-like protein